MIPFLHVLGGIALILFGVRFLRKGLDKLVGPRLPIWVSRLTGGPSRTAFAGIALGLLAPSSSTQGLLTVSLVREGAIRFSRAIVLLMGAYLGATLLVHLLALDVTEHAPIGLLVGIALFQFARTPGPRGLGQIVLAITFVLMGIGIVSNVTARLQGSEDLASLASLASSYPWLAALLAAAITATFQSTTATLAILIGLARTNPEAATPELVLSFVCGANVGVSVIAIVAGWSNIDARRFSLASAVNRLLVAVAVLSFASFISGLVESLPGSATQQLATAHSLFNLGALLLALPAAPVLAALMLRVVRSKRSNGSLEPEAIDPRWADDPGMALAQTKREIGIAVRVTVSMLRDAWTALHDRDELLLDEIRRRDNTVDRIDRHVKTFLTRQLTKELDPIEVRRQLLQLRFIGDLEAVADVIDRRLCDTALKASRRGVRFSDEGFGELQELFERVAGVVELAGATFIEERHDLAERLLKMKDETRDFELALRDRHYMRLQHGLKEAIETTGLHLEMLGQLKHIAHVVAGVAYGVLELHASAAVPPAAPDAAPGSDSM